MEDDDSFVRSRGRVSVGFRSRADSVSLADSLESCWFARILLIRENLAESVRCRLIIMGTSFFEIESE